MRRVSTVTLPDISMRQLEYLVAVADAPTWSTAADRVGVSASALSQGLAELERRLGVELFEPAGRRRVLRTSARPALDHARQVLGLTRDLVTWSERVRTGRSGRVRVGMIDVAAVVHYPDVIREFRIARPDVELTLHVAPSAVLLDELLDGAIDLAVCVAPTVGASSRLAGIDVVPLLDEPLVVLAPPGAVVGPPSGWGPWLLFPTGSHTRRQVEDRLIELGAPVRVAAESHQPDVLIQMAVLGFGWTVLPRGEVEAPLTAGPELATRSLVLASRSGAVADPATTELAGRLRAV